MTAQPHQAQAEDAPKKTITHNRIHDRGRSPSTGPRQKPNKDQQDHKNIVRMMLINLELLPIDPNKNFQKYQHKPNKIKNSPCYSSNRAILTQGPSGRRFKTSPPAPPYYSLSFHYRVYKLYESLGSTRKMIPDASRSFWYLQILILRKFIFDENFHPNSDFSPRISASKQIFPDTPYGPSDAE